MSVKFEARKPGLAFVSCCSLQMVASERVQCVRLCECGMCRSASGEKPPCVHVSRRNLSVVACFWVAFQSI